MASVPAARAGPRRVRRPALRPGALRTGWAIPAAAAFLGLALLAFVRSYDPDEAVYSIMASGIVDGRWPYRDLFDHKPPLIYLWYLPTALGASIEAQRLFAAAAVTASFPAMARLARRWLDAAQVGPALTAYALLLANPYLALGANSEAFMLPALTWAFAVSSPLLAGALIGVAVMTKPVALAFVPLLVAPWGRRSWPGLAGVALVILAVSAAFVPVWDDYWYANVTFNVRYGAHIDAFVRLTRLLVVNPLVVAPMLPVWYLALRGARALPDARLLLWVACGYVSVKLTGFDFPHYYALAVPPVALLAGAGARGVSLRSPGLRALGAVSAALLVAGLVVALLRPGDPLAEEARRTPGELYVLGDRSELYAYAGRKPQRRFFYSVPLVVDRDRGASVRDDLTRCPPDVVVVPRNNVFSVDWQDDVGALYHERVEFDEGVIYRHPRAPCVEGEVQGP